MASPRRPAQRPAPAPAAAARLPASAAPVLLVASAALAYHNALHGPFIFDDVLNIRSNYALRDLWPVWKTMWGPLDTGVAGRPVVQLSFALNYAVHGLDVVGYHVVNVALHVAASLLLYGIVRRTLLTRRLADRFAVHAPLLALLVALVWQVHPLLSDSVTYISGRTEILGAVFLLLTLYSAIRAATAKSAARARWWRVGAVTFCVIGTGCKEIMVAAPLLVLLYDRVFIAESFREIVRARKGMYAALFLSWILIPLNLYKANFHRSALVSAGTLSSWDYLKTQSEVLVLYLRLSVWPHPLILDYHGWPTHPPLASVWPEGLIILLLLSVTIFGVFRMAPVAFLGAWCFLILAPTSSFLPLATEVATERRTYLPLMAIVALVVLCGYRAIFIVREKSPGVGRFVQYGAVAIVSLIVAAEILRTLSRNEQFRDPIALWTDVIVHRPNNYRAYDNLGYELLGKGQTETARECFLRSIRLDGTNYIAMNNVAALYIAEDDARSDERAVGHLKAALALKPDYAAAHLNLGRVYYARGEFDSAEQSLREARRLAPARTDVLLALAKTLLARGKPDEAAQLCQEALGLEPRSALAHDQLGEALMRLGRPGEGLAALRTALEIAPGDAEIASHFAWHLTVVEESTLRNTKEAVAIAESAVKRTNGQKAVALDALGLAYASDGRFQEAVAAAGAAGEIMKDRRPRRAEKIEARRAAYAKRQMPETELLRFGD